MDSFEANKIFGAVLGTIFVLFGGSLLAEGLFHSEAPEEPGYEIVAAEPADAGSGGAEVAAEDPPIAALLQTASVDDGAAVFKKCASCHSGEKGGKNGIGPHLWGVVMRPIASVSDFSYSSAMSDFSEGGSVDWDYDHLYHFLKNPKSYISGTKMGFAGLKKPEDRANVIAYLHSLADSPAPLPEAPAEGEAATEGGEQTAEVTNPATTTKMGAGGEETQAPAESGASPEAPPVESSDATTEAKMSAEGVQGEQPAPPAEAEATPEQARAPEATAPAEDKSASSEQPAAAAPEAAEPTQTAMAGDPAAGEKVFNKCKACHAIGEGAKNKIGPELNGILGEKIAAVDGYKFSSSLQDYAKEHDVWTVEELQAWLADPKALASNTKMSFPGLKKSEDIDNVIAYLASFDENGAQKSQ